MRFSYNRFAVIPCLCTERKRYVWLEPYRRANVWRGDRFLKENICRPCLSKFIPNHYIEYRAATYILKENEDD